MVSPADNFARVLRIAGCEDFHLQGLVWTRCTDEAAAHAADDGQHQRLFGVSLRGFAFEIDLQTGMLAGVTDSYTQAWCIAACPRSPTLAIGGEDSVKLFSHAGDKLTYLRSLPQGVRVLCNDYHPAQGKLIIGCADSSIRCLDETTGRGLFHLNPSSGVPACVVQSCLARGDHNTCTIVAGTSYGVVVYEEEMQAAAFAGDIVSLAAHPLGSAHPLGGVVHAGTRDGRVLCLTTTEGVWGYSHSARGSAHDISTLALVPRCQAMQADYPGSEVLLVSGSADGRVVLFAGDQASAPSPGSGTSPFSLHVLSAWHPSLISTTSYGVQQQGPDAGQGQRIAIASTTSVEIWQSSPSSSSSSTSSEVQLLVKMCFRSTPEHITAVRFITSDDLLVMTATSLSFYHLLVSSTEGVQVQVQVQKRVSLSGAYGAVTVSGTQQVSAYLTKTQEIVTYTSEGVELRRMPAWPVDKLISDKLTHRLSHHVQQLAVYQQTVIMTSYRTLTIITPLAVTAFTTSVVLDLLFLTDSILAVLSAGNELLLYDLLTATLHAYSARHGAKVVKLLSPDAFRFPLTSMAIIPVPGPEPVVPVASAPSRKRGSAAAAAAVVVPEAGKLPGLLLYGAVCAVVIDLNTPPPPAEEALRVLRHPISAIYRNRDTLTPASNGSLNGTKKRKAAAAAATSSEEQQGTKNFTVLERYRNVLYMGPGSRKELVVVENPWARIVQKMPDALHRKRYMT